MDQPDRLPVPLSLDLPNECVHHGERPLKLTPKAFAVLRHLMERPGLLTTKDALLTAVWPDTAVSEASLSTCIREIRRALGDTPGTPRYIQTVHRRGYRYVARTVDRAVTVDRRDTVPSRDRLFVGRARELAILERSLRQVPTGERRLILLSGEPGIGKTALLERFATHMTGRMSVQIARGQCIEQYGACEAYLPWFEVLDQLARDCGWNRLTAVLRQYAPMWLAQLPWLLDADERQQLQREIAGATRDRMLREMAETLRALSTESPVIVILEDLHWSDPSSIGLLAYLTRRSRMDRLMLLGTYRPSELTVRSHPLVVLKHELLLHGSGEDISLEFLTTDAVAEYVGARMLDAPDGLARRVHQVTEGNPLFMVNVIDYLLARGTAVIDDGCSLSEIESVRAAEAEVPKNLLELIERQIDRLVADDRRLLEAASVTGVAFNAASAAAALEETVESTEERLGLLARRGLFIRLLGRQTWPDGTESDAYSFIHALYQNVLYERLGSARRSRFHLRTGEHLEIGYHHRAGEIAAELALHFQHGRDFQRAVQYIVQAAERAIQRSAYVEAIALLRRGIALLPMLPASADHDDWEIQLRVPLGVCYTNTRGYAAPEVGMTFQRAHELCRHATDPSRQFHALCGLWFFAVQQADLGKARSIAETLLKSATRARNASELVEAHRMMATTRFHGGDFARAHRHIQRGLAWYDAKHHSATAWLYGQDPGVCCHAWFAWAQWYQGYPDGAVASARDAIELARGIGHPFSLSYAMNFAAHLHLWRGDATAAEEHAREAIRYAQEQGLPAMLAVGQILHGWSRTALRGDDAAIGELREGVLRWRSTGARLVTPYWTYLLASALDKADRSAEAMTTLDDALAQLKGSDERWFESELYVLKASLVERVPGTGRADPGEEAHRHLRRAYRTATALASPPLQLLAANALSVVLRRQGRHDEAKHLVGTSTPPSSTRVAALQTK
jgi:DNA-binding winged helix-turn-helix (wHTH) protein/predicted ATPase